MLFFFLILNYASKYIFKIVLWLFFISANFLPAIMWLFNSIFVLLAKTKSYWSRQIVNTISSKQRVFMPLLQSIVKQRYICIVYWMYECSICV